MNRRANQLARYLQRQGVGPEVRVGICLERSPELVLAVLGVLKAGGAYVPLDVAYTQDAAERTRFVLEDAQVSLVLTQSALSASLDRVRAPRLVLDGAAAERIGCGEWRACGRRGRGGQLGLRSVHVGLDRPAQGRDGHARQPAERLLRLGAGLRSGLGGARRICRWPVSASMCSRAIWCGPSARAASW